MKKLYTLVFAMLMAVVAYGQPPIPSVGYNLSTGTPYSFTEWSASSSIATYPANTTLLTTFRTGPDEWATRYNSPNGRLGVWLCPYNLTGRSRFVGLDSRGIQFILTGSGQNILCNALPVDTIQSRPFAFNLGLNTNNISEAVVRYTVQVTQLGDGATPRQASLALGYRTNLTDTFRLVPGATIFSTAGRALNDSLVVNLSLPSVTAGLDLLQLAWIYYLPEVTGASGSRPYIRLDNVSVLGTPTSAGKKAAFQFAVAPNPSQGAVRITDSYIGEKQIYVTNLLGAKIAEVTSDATVTELNIQTKGMYMLTVKHAATGETATRKLIVE